MVGVTHQIYTQLPLDIPTPCSLCTYPPPHREHTHPLPMTSDGDHWRPVQTCSFQGLPRPHLVVATETETHTSGRYTSYWNGFLYCQLFAQTIRSKWNTPFSLQISPSLSQNLSKSIRKVFETVKANSTLDYQKVQDIWPFVLLGFFLIKSKVKVAFRNITRSYLMWSQIRTWQLHMS